MPFKGFNSIIIDFDAVIDVELSIINWMRENREEYNLDLTFEKEKILYEKMDDLKFKRIYGPYDLFADMIRYDDLKDRTREIVNVLYKSHTEGILKNAIGTSMQPLIRAYKKAGNGTIKTAVRCDTKAEAEYVKSIAGDTPIELCSRKDVDMDKYTRVIVGYYKDAFEYKLKTPKSILILDYRENFSPDDNTKLHPELVIKLGDINDIRVASAYRELILEDEPEG